MLSTLFIKIIFTPSFAYRPQEKPSFIQQQPSSTPSSNRFLQLDQKFHSTHDSLVHLRDIFSSPLRTILQRTPIHPFFWWLPTLPLLMDDNQPSDNLDNHLRSNMKINRNYITKLKILMFWNIYNLWSYLLCKLFTNDSLDLSVSHFLFFPTTFINFERYPILKHFWLEQIPLRERVLIIIWIKLEKEKGLSWSLYT